MNDTSLVLYELHVNIGKSVATKIIGYLITTKQWLSYLQSCDVSEMRIGNPR